MQHYRADQYNLRYRILRERFMFPLANDISDLARAKPNMSSIDPKDALERVQKGLGALVELIDPKQTNARTLTGLRASIKQVKTLEGFYPLIELVESLLS